MAGAQARASLLREVARAAGRRAVSYTHLVRTGNFDRPGLNGLGALCLAAQDEYGLAQRRGLLLNAAGVGHDHVAPGNQAVHVYGG